MRVGACYIRVSTDDQADLSPDSQLAMLQQYARQHDIILNKEHIFIDEGISGRKSKNRPEFQRMIGMAKQNPKPFDVILVWKFSRFARNQEESIFYKSLLRKEQKIDVVSVSENIDDSPFGSLIERIIEWFDEYYSIRLGEEVKRSMIANAEKGVVQTGAPFGYRKKPGQPLEIYEPEARWVRYIFRRFLEGASYFAIARELKAAGVKTKAGNEFENRAVEYIINNPMYAGYVRWTPTGQTVGKRIYDDPNTIIVKGDFPAIITKEIWDACHEIVLQRKATRTKGERPAETKKHWLIGLLKCGTCGRALTYTAKNNGFQCWGYSKNLCARSHFIQLPKIENMVYEGLAKIRDNETYLQNLRIVTDKEDETESIMKQIAKSETMLERAKTAYIEGLDTIEEYKENKRRITEQIEVLKEQLQSCRATAEPDVPQIQKKIDSIIELLQDPDVEHEIKYNAIRDIVEKITFKRPEETVSIYLYTSNV